MSIDWITKEDLLEIAKMRHGSHLVSMRPAVDCLAHLRVKTPYGIRDRKIHKGGLTNVEVAHLKKKGYEF